MTRKLFFENIIAMMHFKSTERSEKAMIENLGTFQ